jgi:hypothetical protein
MSNQTASTVVAMFAQNDKVSSDVSMVSIRPLGRSVCFTASWKNNKMSGGASTTVRHACVPLLLDAKDATLTPIADVFAVVDSPQQRFEVS